MSLYSKSNVSYNWDIAAPNIPSSGLCGTVFTSIPANACVPLAPNEGGGEQEQIKEEEDREEDLISSLDHVAKLRFVVILRGLCSFEEKVRNAQDAGYDAVIVADNVDNGPLPTSKCSIFWTSMGVLICSP